METKKLRDVKRKGVSLYGVKDPESIIEHSFRTAFMAWILGEERKIDIEKAIKISIIHELAKIQTGDITPYDALLSGKTEKREKILKKWVRLPLSKKKEMEEERIKKQYKALLKIISKLPARLKKELEDLWLDFQNQRGEESRFIAQVNVIENLIAAVEWKKKNKDFPTESWWEHAQEVVYEPILLKLLKEIEKEEISS